jgi:hypothetical protein
LPKTILWRRTLVLLAGAASLGSACPGGGGGGGLPPPDACAGADGAGLMLSSLEIGPGTNGAFQAWRDGDVVPIVYGGQGGRMITVRVRIRGAALPACLPQKTTVLLAEGTQLGYEPSPLVTYAEADGSRTTKPLYVQLFGSFSSGSALIVRVEAGDQSTSRSLYLDALPDGGA